MANGYTTDLDQGSEQQRRFGHAQAHPGLADTVRVFGWLIPADVGTYLLVQLDDATSWVSEGAGG